MLKWPVVCLFYLLPLISFFELYMYEILFRKLFLIIRTNLVRALPLYLANKDKLSILAKTFRT